MKKDQTIPVVDLRDFTSDSKKNRQDFISTVGRALEDTGFFALEGHGVQSGLIDQAYGLATRFFEMSEATKRRYEDAAMGGQRGYTSFGREHAKDSSAPDLKEFWHVGRELPSWHGLAKTYLQNVWPAEIAEFKPVFLRIYELMDACSMELLKACALYLGEPETLFSDMAREGNTILRVIHYPPIPDDYNPASVRAAAHEDINLITLLCEATDDGLELLQRDGSWRPIRAVPGQIIVDTGDMIQNLTNGVLKSTTHRVVNPGSDKSRRFSMPFFVHPRSEVSLDPLASCIARSGGDKKYADIMAGDYLNQRLKEIGLYK
jgi:isopenicillin N synthase-like dioxygenase